VLTNSVLFYIKEEDGCEPHVVAEIVLASVRDASSEETPYTFELTFGNKRTYTLQAEGKESYDSWVDAIRDSVENQLTGSTNTFQETYGSGQLREVAELIMGQNPLCAVLYFINLLLSFKMLFLFMCDRIVRHQIQIGFPSTLDVSFAFNVQEFTDLLGLTSPRSDLFD